MIKKNKTAFTLIELSIVVTLIGIIIGVAIIGGIKLSNNAKLVAARALTSSSPVKDMVNLELWLDSTSKESFKESEIYGSGNISVWYDINKQSDYKNNATQATLIYQPSYESNIINGLPAVFFSSNSSVGMTINDNLNITGNHSIFIVHKTSSSLSGRALQSRNINWLLGSWGSNCICHHNNGVWISSTVAQAPDKVYLAEVIRNTITKFYVNGVDRTTINSIITPPGTLGLGATGTFNEPMNGYIAEVIVFTRDLNDSERQDVENYLIKKWKIS